MVRLRPMTEAEYNEFLPHLLEDYAQERARNMGQGLEHEREESRKQIEQLLPQGAHSPGHLLWRIVADDGQPVGVLWVALDENTHTAFIYDIELGAAHRDRGYGTQALAALEGELRPRGIQTIALNVFGDNARARHVYEKAGYTVAAIHMAKRLDPGQQPE